MFDYVDDLHFLPPGIFEVAKNWSSWKPIRLELFGYALRILDICVYVYIYIMISYVSVFHSMILYLFDTILCYLLYWLMKDFMSYHFLYYVTIYHLIR